MSIYCREQSILPRRYEMETAIVTHPLSLARRESSPRPCALFCLLLLLQPLFLLRGADRTAFSFLQERRLFKPVNAFLHLGLDRRLVVLAGLRGVDVPFQVESPAASVRLQSRDCRVVGKCRCRRRSEAAFFSPPFQEPNRSASGVWDTTSLQHAQSSRKQGQELVDIEQWGCVGGQELEIRWGCKGSGRKCP